MNKQRLLLSLEPDFNTKPEPSIIIELSFPPLFFYTLTDLFLLQILGNLIDNLLLNDLLEELYLNLNIGRGGDTAPLHLPRLLCLHLKDVGSQRSQNILIRREE